MQSSPRRSWNGWFLLSVIFILLFSTPFCLAEDERQDIQKLDDVLVQERAIPQVVEQSPTQTTIDFQNYPTIGDPTSVLDLLKTQAIIDFRGQTDLDPGVDTIFMRGFESKRFVTAIDSMTLQKTGGRKASNIVDYSVLPTFLIDKVEILPGPHSALYDSKSIGGVINFVSKAPIRRDTLKPDARLSASYGSYGTQNYNAVVNGAIDSLTYDVAYQRYYTDGYLRSSEVENDTVYGRLGFVLPESGFVTLSAAHSDVKRQIPVNNPGTDGDYDGGYPTVEDSAFQPWQDPTWDGKSFSYRLNYEQSLAIGRLKAGAYYSKDNRDWSYFYTNTASGNQERYSLDTDWWQKGAKIQDQFNWSANHTTTLGLDIARLYDEGVNEERIVGIDKRSGYLQHRWGILSALDLTLGLRYEKVKINVGDWSATAPYIPEDGYVECEWDGWVPKSFATWRMDEIAPWLRDTSLSAGVSKIWRAPDYLGEYNPRGWPTGYWLDDEHGMGYDLVIDRRLWQDIALKINYSFYDIKDYVASNGTYANNTTVAAGQNIYSDYVINLEKVHRHGVELALGGHLTDTLSFNLSYAWQKFYNQGDEPAFETELDQRAEHRVTAGLRYDLFRNTSLMLDYYYQSEETTQISEEVTPDVWEFREVANDAYHLFDFGVSYTFFKQKGVFKDAVLQVYVKNLFDEKYYDASGYPATDRTFGTSFSIGF